jgi:hypothetical protein
VGILHQVAIEAMRKHFIDELRAEGVTRNKEGKSIYDMSYNELKSELALASIRKVNVESPDNKWF